MILFYLPGLTRILQVTHANNPKILAEVNYYFLNLQSPYNTTGLKKTPIGF